MKGIDTDALDTTDGATETPDTVPDMEGMETTEGMDTLADQMGGMNGSLQEPERSVTDKLWDALTRSTPDKKIEDVDGDKLNIDKWKEHLILGFEKASGAGGWPSGVNLAIGLIGLSTQNAEEAQEAISGDDSE